MSKRMISDAAMREACGVVRSKMLDSMQDCEAPTFSDGFREKMQELNRRSVRSARLRSLLRKSIAAVIVLILCLGAVLTFSPEARAEVMEHFKQMFPGHSWYWFQSEEITGSVSYAPTWIPEGYEPESDETDAYNAAWRSIRYQNPEKPEEYFLFHIDSMADGGQFHVTSDAETTEVVSVSVNGLPGDLYISGDPEQAHYLVWVDEEAKMLFCITSPLDPDVMLQIAESVALTD